MFVSIIVPIYNSEKFLRQCLDSILCQEFSSFELILVNDGSTDSSLSICKEYAQKDNRVMIVDKEHSGIVESRKVGINYASGRYCMFVDSDDWISTDLLEKLSIYIREDVYDMIHYNMITVSDSNKVTWEYLMEDGIYEGVELERIYKKMMFDFEKGKPGIIQSLATKLIKRELLVEVSANVDGRITLGEDAAIVYNAMLNSNRIFVTNEIYYFYRYNNDSLCHSKDISRFSEIFYFKEYMQRMYEKYSDRFNLQRQLQAYLIHFICIGIRAIYNIELNEVYQVPVEINPTDNVIIYAAGKVGQSYYRELNKRKINICAWIDKKLSGQMVYEKKIDNISALKDVRFDIMLIAVKSECLANAIIDELVDKYNLPKEKVIWKEPKSDWREFFFNI